MTASLSIVAWLVLAVPYGVGQGEFPCVKHHGRLSSQNGITLRIWLIGTTRSVGVDGPLPKAVADLADPYLMLTGTDHSYIFGDFTICPTEPDRPGHLRWVRVTAAEKLVVQNLQGLRPAFRVLSTWPPSAAPAPPARKQ